MHGHRVWILWLPVFTRAQAKRCLYAAIQLSRCRVILIFPFTIYGVSEAFFHPLLTEDANHSLICPKFRAETRFVLGVLSNPSGTIRKVQYTLSLIWNKHRLLVPPFLHFSFLPLYTSRRDLLVLPAFQNYSLFCTMEWTEGFKQIGYYHISFLKHSYCMQVDVLSSLRCNYILQYIAVLKA